MLPSCFYSVHAGNPDMLSLAFRCDVVRQAPVDSYGLVGGGQPVPESGEVAAALRLAETAAQLVDLDQVLSRDAQLTEQMAAETEVLLRAANYAVDEPQHGYRAWLGRIAY
jgi:hypothetical protein